LTEKLQEEGLEKERKKLEVVETMVLSGPRFQSEEFNLVLIRTRRKGKDRAYGRPS